MKESLIVQGPGRVVELPVVGDPRGCLGFIQRDGGRGVLPFELRRVYWFYDIRGSHEHPPRALRSCDELLVVMSGSACIRLDDGHGNRAEYRLLRPDKALLIPAGTWREVGELATNTVLVVLASTAYDPREVIRDYDDFLKNKEK
ncbi:MAG: FdtA/QdtA family cupin domain-containing protein [Muribaculaceae bacterium]|nr:FdtA/QdtA family cupin domain-containing protein [Muribaculaceae bacterium]